jgi:hypothetical protein
MELSGSIKTPGNTAKPEFKSTQIFAPPSARRNFFYVRHPKFKSWIRPWFMLRNLLFSVML